MTTILITPPATLADGQPAVADDSSFAFRQMEKLFQSGVHGENFVSGPALRGESFASNGMTEVFSRKSTSEHWTLYPGTSQTKWDVPGGALRFRLRRPADVLVFFTASIYRLNHYDSYKHYTSGFTAREAIDIKGARHVWVFNALWEGGDNEPGREYIQAQSLLSGTCSLNNFDPTDHPHRDRPDMPRGVFLPWKIRAVDVDHFAATADGPEAFAVPDMASTRLIAPGAGTSGSEIGRLQAGWHNIRHTAYWADWEDLYGAEKAPAMVFGSSELVVIANYGGSRDDWPEVSHASGQITSGT